MRSLTVLVHRFRQRLLNNQQLPEAHLDVHKGDSVLRLGSAAWHKDQM